MILSIFFLFLIFGNVKSICTGGDFTPKQYTNFQRYTVPTDFHCATEERFWVTGQLHSSPNNFKINLQNRVFNWQGMIEQFGLLYGGNLDLLLDHEFHFYYQNILHWDTWNGFIWQYPISFCDPLPLYPGEFFNISILVGASFYEVVYYRAGQAIKTINHPKTIQPTILDVMGDFQPGTIQVHHQFCCVNGQHCQFKWGDWEGGAGIPSKPPKVYVQGQVDTSDASSHGAYDQSKNDRSASEDSREDLTDARGSRVPNNLKLSKRSMRRSTTLPIQEAGGSSETSESSSDSSGGGGIIIINSNGR